MTRSETDLGVMALVVMTLRLGPAAFAAALSIPHPAETVLLASIYLYVLFVSLVLSMFIAKFMF
jgi:hypothetical protein